MELENIIQSVSYIDSINNIDNLINELLYNQKDGYINLSSKDALKNARLILEKFDSESEKILRESASLQIEKIIKDKRKELIDSIKKHYTIEVFNWVDEVYDGSINNLLFKMSISDNKDSQNEISCKIIDLTNWYCSIKNFSDDKKSSIVSEIQNKVYKALNTKDSDFISGTNPIKTDYDTFIELRKLIIDDTDTFLNIDLNKYLNRLSSNDIFYFNNMKILIKKNKTDIIDKINLVDFAIKQLKLIDCKKQYEFILQLEDDFKELENRSEENIIKIIKRRMKIFKNKDEYYSKLLSS